MIKYPYTCPRIDKNIDHFKGHLEEFVTDLVSELNPLFSDTDKATDFIQKQCEYFYSEVEGLFEDLRQSNEELRSVATEQLEELQQLKDEAETVAEELRQQLSELEK